MIALVIGLLVGFLMCIPVGPINVWVVNTLLKKNFKSAIAIALGGSIMDFVYFMIILTGLSFVKFSDTTILTLKILGVLFLFGFGLKELLTKQADHEIQEKNDEKERTNLFSYFLLGVLIYTSNPTLIATMSGLAAFIKSWEVFESVFINYLMLSFGVALGSFSWFYFLLKLVERYQEKIPAKFYHKFSQVSGLLIIIFSFIMAFNVYKEVIV